MLPRALYGWAAYVLLSLGLTGLLFIDPLIDGPSGLIKLRWFTRRPPSHGLDACSWDYEGSWRVGLARGDPDPAHLSFSAEPVITCATLANATAVSFVADPFLYIPDNRTAKWLSVQRGADGAAPWFAFYEMKNLRRYIGELGAAVSYDQGSSWRHLGTVLSEPFHLSFPFVLYDEDTSKYLMFAETSGAGDGAIRIYGASEEEFPFGWELVATRQPYDPGWAATRHWSQSLRGARPKYVDTAPVKYNGKWWIFTSRVGSPGLRQPKYTLLVYTAEKLLGEWTPHPAAAAGAPYLPFRPTGRVPYGVDAERSTARSGGRPFVLNGSLHRWAQDCSRYYGESLVLMRADVANETSYRESVVVRYDPTRDGQSWRAERMHHADMQQLPDGSWVGLVDGDRYRDGTAHFVARERWFVDLKAQLRTLLVAQLLLVAAAMVLLHGVAYASSAGGSAGAVTASLRAALRQWLPSRGGGGGDGAGKGGGCCASAVTAPAAAVGLRLRWVVPAPLVAALAGGGGALVAVAGMVATAVAVSVCLMALLPGLVACPRWPVLVPPFPSSPHFVPEAPHADPHAPYNLTNVTVVTGCSATFVDRLENLVGSLQYWAPGAALVVYDLGFSSEQLAEMRCWSGVELRRFPWESFPSHVRELTTYAFKPLTYRLALEAVPPGQAILWIDCGLEVRAPLTPLLATLAARGHVGAQQSTSPGRQGWPLGHMAERFRYVRGSDAHRLVLEPVAACSLDRDRCIAPPGHSRAQHCYDQTAFTLLLRHHNFSTCLPRELYATSSTRKTSYDPRVSSAPLVVASRRHRQPKPYRSLLRRMPSCRADPGSNPWPTIASEHTESTSAHSSLTALASTYGGALLDFAVQSGCCLGLHLTVQVALWAQVRLLGWGRHTMRALWALYGGMAV
ncbi:hypothetical protein GPECTOR_5g328 [Gonium pectorale]|uniref:Glucosamine inositolphosphorylceramide transferase 1 N-terminal domain-containing protein n=1 Tax=Gonium pectorale TaxID=33097 RepID=A0A150GWG6_GONPE|nr:hypothetical protein GPECTOR_5g328 [Gonium pectorale]|eukprot:KXZ54237.1 hypothetical protein GPECTOR_5g328 [Gonium pectorale]